MGDLGLSCDLGSNYTGNASLERVESSRGTFRVGIAGQRFLESGISQASSGTNLISLNNHEWSEGALG